MDPSPQTQIVLLADGYVATQLLFVAVDLRIPDALADGPRTAAELADAAGVDPSVLHRVLRGLASFGVLAELTGDRFDLTPTGALLREGVPGSVRGLVLARGELYYGAFGKLRDAVRTGGSAFELAYGERIFAFLGAHEDIATAFQASMTDRSNLEIPAIVAAYDFGRLSSVVDVGGGRGAMLLAILNANPSLSGVLFDQPDVVAQALDTLPARCERVGGDFFQSVPAGADAYVLSRVIHNWGDADATRILTNCRKAMAKDGRVLLVETVLPERAIDQPPAVRLDLTVMVMTGGGERTESELGDLLATAGLKLNQVILVDEATGLHIVEAKPA